MPGMHGTVAAVAAMQRADLLVALGARFDDRVTGQLATFAPDAAIVHADIDPAEISKNRKADVPIVGDCAEIISELITAVQSEFDHGDRPDLAGQPAQVGRHGAAELAYRRADGHVLRLLADRYLPQPVLAQCHQEGAVVGADRAGRRLGPAAADPEMEPGGRDGEPGQYRHRDSGERREDHGGAQQWCRVGEHVEPQPLSGAADGRMASRGSPVGRFRWGAKLDADLGPTGERLTEGWRCRHS